MARIGVRRMGYGWMATRGAKGTKMSVAQDSVPFVPSVAIDSESIREIRG
jgi:hypothetical protein